MPGVETPPIEPPAQGRVDTPVTLVSHAFGYGGDLLYYGELFRALARRLPGLAIAVDRSMAYRDAGDLPLVPMVRQFRIPLRPGAGAYRQVLFMPSPGFAWALWRRRPRVVVVIEFTPVALLAIAASLFRRGTRRVILVESDPSSRDGSRHPLMLAAKRWAVARAHVVQTSNAAGAAYVTGTLRADPASVRVAPYLTSRPPGPPADLTPAPELRLLFVNGLTARKGLAHLIAAMALLPPDILRQVRLTIVGDGDERGALEAQVVSFELNERVDFVGSRPYRDLGAYFAAADVLVSPTLRDYRSLSSFEGLAYGLALLISAEDGAHHETVVSGETGYIFAPEDHADLATKIAAFATDRALLARCRRGALALFERRFTVDRIADDLAATVRQALDA